MMNFMKDKNDLPIGIDSVLWEVVRMCESATGKEVDMINGKEESTGRFVFYYGDKDVASPLIDAIEARLGCRFIESTICSYERMVIVTFKLADVDFLQELGDVNKKWKDDENEGNTYAHKLQEVKAIKVERYNVERLINFVGGGQMTITRDGTAVFSFLNNGAAYLDAPEHSYVVRVGESRFNVVPEKDFENEWELK